MRVPNKRIILHFVAALAYRVGIFDAGSTGTRLSIYSFKDGNVEAVKTFKRQGGMHTESLDRVKESIDYLVRESQVDASTPLWFHGTAGMRSLPPGLQAAVLSEVKEALTNYNMQGVRILSAGDEGTYMLKAFEHLSPHNQSFIILGMGGLSVQLIKNKEDLVEIESYELGITKSNCEEKNGIFKYLSAEKTRAFPFQCPAGIIEEKFMKMFYADENIQMLDFYCKQSQCIIENFINNSLRELKANCNGYSVFLCSYLNDLFASYGKVFTLGSIKKTFKSKCRYASADCGKIHYAIMFLERLGFCDEERLYTLQKIGGFDLTWALGRAVEAEANFRSTGRSL